jgi:hypothetical protein
MSNYLSEEKKELMKQIETSCDTAILGMKKLNRSLESISEVGQGIDKISEAWQRSNETLGSSQSKEINASSVQ